MYYVYKTTNIVNNKIYVGVHKSDNIQNDGYLGSGKYLNRAIKRYGKQNFKRQILFQLKTQKLMYQKQKQLVNQEFLKRQDVYNIDLGGKGGLAGMVVVKDKDGNVLKVPKDDPRYLSGQLVHPNKGTFTARDKEGNKFRVSKDDPRYLSGQLVGHTKGRVTVRDKDGNTLQVSINDPRYLSGQLVYSNKGMVPVRDKDGNIFQVSTDDPRYLSGQLVHNCKGLILVKDKEGIPLLVPKDDPRYLSGQLLSVNEGKIVVKDKEGNTFKVHKADPRWLSGQLVGVNKGIKMPKNHQKGSKNSQYGTMWITNGIQNKKIKKEDPIPQNWIRGRSFIK